MDIQHKKKICVLGSANEDIFLYVNKIPEPGETIQSNEIKTANGGKGANQAVAAGKLAGSSSFIGQVGNDSSKVSLEKEMKLANVDLHWKVLEDEVTGKAYIYVDKKGENSIVIHGGANMKFGDKLSKQFEEVIDKCDYLLLQKEIPQHINVDAAKYANSKGKTIVLDCGGRDEPISPELLNNITYLSPNETQLQRIQANFKIGTENVAEEIREKLLSKYPNLKILLKQGSDGAAIITKTTYVQGQAVTKINPKVLEGGNSIVDTVGAGDCFTAAFVVAHSELDWSDKTIIDENYRKAIIFGNSSAFLCITKKGAMPSMPMRKDVDQLIGNYGLK